jgi:cation/acetate symporter
MRGSLRLALRSCASLLALSLVCNPAWADSVSVIGSSTTTFAFFGIFLVLVLGICVWAARRANSADEYLTAASSITPTQNGFAIAGDYL